MTTLESYDAASRALRRFTPNTRNLFDRALLVGLDNPDDANVVPLLDLMSHAPTHGPTTRERARALGVQASSLAAIVEDRFGPGGWLDSFEELRDTYAHDLGAFAAYLQGVKFALDYPEDRIDAVLEHWFVELETLRTRIPPVPHALMERAIANYDRRRRELHTRER